MQAPQSTSQVLNTEVLLRHNSLAPFLFRTGICYLETLARLKVLILVGCDGHLLFDDNLWTILYILTVCRHISEYL